MTDGTEHETSPLTADEVVEIVNSVESDVTSEDWAGASREHILKGVCNRIRGRVRARSLSQDRRSVDTGSDRSGGER